MQKKTNPQSGIFNIRVLIAVALCSIGASLGWLSFASTPPTSSPTVPSTGGQTVTVTWTGSIPPLTNATSDCSTFAGTPAVDQHVSTINVPAGTYSAVNANFKFSITWTPVANLSSSDEILTVLKPDATALGSSDGGTNVETVLATNLAAGAYTIVACGFTNAQPQPYTGTLTITTTGIASPTPTPSPGTGFGGPDPTVANVPRYQNFYAPNPSSAQSGAGEFNIGYDPLTKRIMAMNTGPIWRLTPGEVRVPSQPECCEALWEDKDAPSTNTGLDPILFTDSGFFNLAGYVPKTGRTFASNSTAGANAVYAYTDAAAPFNDGDAWIPVGAAPPNGGADHETIGSGPFPASLSVLTTPLNQGEYVLYCSQNLVGSTCQRSLDLGASYGNGVPATGPGALNSQGCGGLHGHARIAPDGTAWLPDKGCGTKAGGAISLDSSTTPWTEFSVSGNNDNNGGAAFTTVPQNPGGADPSVALDANSTAYYCYVNSEAGGSEGHVHVAVGKRGAGTSTAITWIRDTDVGLSHGIVNAAEPEAIGGSAGRAACGFMGTNKNGDWQAGTYVGMDWYIFIATTYDEGRTWVTVNATPNDPVQHNTGVWQGGGSGVNGNRNLLDFNEITVDEKGRVLYGYSDGCVTPGCIAKTAAQNDKVAYMRVARQFGGKTLWKQGDITEPTQAKPACLSGTRDSSASHLTWKIPDNGGSDIVGYQILRSTTTGTETSIVANTGNTNTTYNDTTALSTVTDYFYTVKAINQSGTVIGLSSNEVDLRIGVAPPVATPCIEPGILTVDDTNADGTDNDPAPNTPPDPSVNVRQLYIAEPYVATGVPAGSNKLVFTMQVAPSTLPTPPPNSQWLIVWNALAPDANFDRRYVAMVTSATGAVSFDYGKFGVGLAATNPNPNANTPNRLGAADSGSYNQATGVIRIVLSDSSAENIAAGGALTGVNVRTYFNRPDYPGFQRSQNNASDITGSGAYTLVGNNSCFPLLSVVSRKTHAFAGPFDIDLPLSGSPGIECRSGGTNNDYTIIYTFTRSLFSVGSATVSHGVGGGTGSVSSQTFGPLANQYTVNVTNVSNAQHLSVTLDGVQDSAGALINNLTARMDVLVGDSTADGTVNSADITQTRRQSGNVAHGDPNANFRQDVTADGTINSADITAVRRQSGTALP